MKKVIIDTDIGDDIDDALAIALALNSPELEILAITTVYGKVNVRAKLVAKLLKASHRLDIPVAPGCSKPIINEEPTRLPIQANAINLNEKFNNIIEKHTVDLILELLESERHVTIVTLGPLTNIALALLKNKEAFKHANLVIMGGCIKKQIAEYNIKCDPEAAYIVFNSGTPITLVTLDATLKCIMTDEMVNTIYQSKKPMLKVLHNYLELWRKYTHRRNPILHDPLTVATSFNDNFVFKEQLYVTVELNGKLTRGYTIILPHMKPNMNVCTDVKVQDFLDFYRNRVLT